LLRESNDVVGEPDALRARVEEDGYLFLRAAIGRDVVLAARRELLEKLASVDEVDTSRPLMDAVVSGRTSRHKAESFGEQFRTGPALRDLVDDRAVSALYETMFGEGVRRLDFIWVRSVLSGNATGCHYDWVYMGRGSRRLHTSWIPIGDVPYEDGALMVLENSHRIEELVGTYGRLDVDGDEPNPYAGGWFSKNWVEVRERFGGRWLTASDGGFRAGDMLVLGVFTLHCSLDNRSEGRIRLSSDTRYQPASEPADERWIGERPIAHGDAARELARQRRREAAGQDA
jgi:ectoine hydroxylase-related dioxygenase (phytanoyl-CoA dioxygenase family)